MRSIQKAFTVLELLIAIGVLAVLCALAIPAIRKAVDGSRSSACQANLRNISVGMIQYATEHKNWMPPHLETLNLPGGQRVYPKWYAWIAPYITLWDMSNPVQTPMDKVFHCPAHPKPYDPSLTYYPGAAAKGDYSYGYNYRFLTSKKDTGFVNQLPMPSIAVKEPQRLVLVTDIPAAETLDATRSEEGMREVKAGWIHPSALTVTRRHNGGSNVLFLDGHIEYRKGDDILGSNYDGGNWTPYSQ